MKQVADLAPGSWVRVACENWAGLGLYDPDSPLAVRIFGRYEEPSYEWFLGRVRGAHRRRARLLAGGATSAYRLVNGEGDGLPGLVVDVYGAFAVIRLDGTAVEPLLPWVTAAVEAVISPKGVVRRAGGGLEVLAGRAPPERLIVSEHGLRFYADIAVGQKTGLFLDHRDNRAQLAPQCAGLRVLNLYCYTGAFSVYAAKAGAVSTVSVDRAADAVARARDNFELNGLPPAGHEFVAEDVGRFLEQCAQTDRRFGVVITDPPSFARSKSQRRKAVRAYEKLHQAALAAVEPGGLYAAASCTSQVDLETFRTSLRDAAARLRRPMQIVAESGQAIDHPVSLAHPEGRYLKFVALRCMA